MKTTENIAKMFQMAQSLVDNGLMTKDERLDLTEEDYQYVADKYFMLNIGVFALSKWEKGNCVSTYSTIN